MKEQAAERKRGDKADWYLRMLGMGAEAEPKTLQEVAQDRDATRTSELVTGMWEGTAELTPTNGSRDPFANWEPHQLSSTARSRRKVRWPVVIVALLLGGLAAFLAWWMPQASERRADNHAELIRESLGAMYGDLAELQQALAVATDPGSSPEDLGSVGVGLAAIAGSSDRLFTVSNQSVPSPLPLTAPDLFDELDQIRSGLEPLAAAAASIRSQVADIADYRIALARVLQVGELPTEADSAAITERGANLAKVLAESVAALTVMPSDGPFAEHRSLVDTDVTAFAQWQDDYLRALRAGDGSETERLIAELHARRGALLDAVVPPLANLRTEVDGQVLDLAQRLAATLDMLPS